MWLRGLILFLVPGVDMWRRHGQWEQHIPLASHWLRDDLRGTHQKQKAVIPRTFARTTEKEKEKYIYYFPGGYLDLKESAWKWSLHWKELICEMGDKVLVMIGEYPDLAVEFCYFRGCPPSWASLSCILAAVIWRVLVNAQGDHRPFKIIKDFLIDF